MSNLGAEVKRLRTCLGMTGAALARRIGVSQPAVFKLEAGGGVDSLTLYRLSDALGVTCDYFRPFIDPSTPAPLPTLEPVAPPTPRVIPPSKRK